VGTDVDLSGTWRAAAGDEEARRDYHDPSYDDGDWALITVPGHWRSNPAFAERDGSVLYRTTFETPEPFGPAAGPRRTWLVLDGVFYTSDVWLDGTYLGDTEGYFFPHSFEVTEPLDAAAQHALAVEVACPRPVDLTAKRNLTGVFQHWDLLDQDWNPGGIWRPVRLEQSGPVRVRHWRVRCGDVTDERAIVSLRAVLDTVDARTVELVTTITPLDEHSGRGPTVSRESRPLAAGENRVEWFVSIPEPDRWWPHALGDQPRYDVEVEIRTDDGAVSDVRTRAIGLRTVEVRDWIWSINGERLFLKGANQGPTRMALAEATPDELAGDVGLAVDAGLDFLRIHAHITRPELYNAADEAGLLIWQDLPLQWGYSRTVRHQARRQAREAVDLLAHHPSIFVWCGHNEPMALDIEPATLADPGRRRRLFARMAAAQALPTWNRTLLDRAVKTVLERNDGTRPVVAHSGVLPHLPQLDGTDSHLYLGWYVGDERDFPSLAAHWPRLARFVTEFGAQAVPETDEFLEAGRWPDLDWTLLARRHALQKVQFDRYVPPAAYSSYADWKAETQAYQARLIRYHIETLRRLKYRPTGGFALFCFADSSPAVTWSVLDHERRPKPGYEALRDACRPVIIVADRPPSHVHPGDRLVLDLHAISDATISHSDIVVSAHLSHGTERWHAWAWQGDLPADSCVRVGTIDVEVPDIDEPLVIDLELEGDGLHVTNRYGTWVRGGDHEH
jgi:beta-mannosidase